MNSSCLHSFAGDTSLIDGSRLWRFADPKPLSHLYSLGDEFYHVAQELSLDNEYAGGRGDTHEPETLGH